MKRRRDWKLRLAVCSRRGNVARVPSLLPLRRARGEMSFCTKFTTAVVLGSMTVGGVAIYDDYLIFQQVSKSVVDPRHQQYPRESVDRVLVMKP